MTTRPDPGRARAVDDCGLAGRLIRGGRPSAADAARLEDHILDIAWSLFMDTGFDGVTIEAIAVTGRLSKRTIYARFENKEALFCRALERHFALWRSEIAASLPVEGFAARMEAFAVRVLRRLATPETEALFRLAYSEGRRFPRILETNRVAVDATVADIAEWMDAERAAGRIDEPDSPFLARCWLDLLLGHSKGAHHMRLEPAEAEALIRAAAPRLTRVFLRMLGHSATGRTDACG